MDEEHTVNLTYLDFAKAFNSVEQQFQKSFAIDWTVLNWIKFYLSKWSCQVQIDGVLKGLLVLVVSPKVQLLFLLYINNLLTALGDSTLFL